MTRPSRIATTTTPIRVSTTSATSATAVRTRPARTSETSERTAASTRFSTERSSSCRSSAAFRHCSGETVISRPASVRPIVSSRRRASRAFAPDRVRSSQVRHAPGPRSYRTPIDSV
ncbi:hypothetical protein SCALM49S_05233 [Streptomyces californicus]